MTPQNEFLKTTAAVAGALLFASLVYLLGPATAIAPSDEALGEYLFEYDPQKSSALEIVEYLPATASVRELKVEKDPSGRWVLPSHEKYPTDAKERLGQAAAAVRYIKRGSKITSRRSDHEELGVVDPITENQPGVKGIGTRVAIKEGGNEVAALVVGRADKDKSDLRYVRIAGKDEVYLAKIDLGRLSTKFDEWIETDLLQLKGSVLQNVVFNNYSVDILNRQSPVKQADILKAAYDDKKDPKDRWTLSEMKRGSKDFKPIQLTEGESVNVDRLDALKTALDDLKIVDVRKKPDELIDLLNGKRQELSQQIASDLVEKGYFPFRGGLLSKEGEIIAEVDGGVRYVLMFGNLAPGLDKEGHDGKGERRYLFVRAELDMENIPAPVEEKYVPKEAGPAKPEEKKPEEKKAEEKPAEPAKTEEKKPEEKKAEEKPAEPAKTEEKKPEEKKAEEKPAEPAKTEEKKPEEKKAEEKAGSAAIVNPSAEGMLALADEAPAAAPAAPAVVPAPAAPAAAPAKPAEDPEKKRIEELNLQRRKDYEKKIKDAKERVEKLNRRFADWYYVIDGDVYNKVHLTRADMIVRAGGASGEAGGDGPLDFKALQQGIDAGK